MSETPRQTSSLRRPAQRARLCGPGRLLPVIAAASATLRALKSLRSKLTPTQQSGNFRWPSIALGLSSRSSRLNRSPILKHFRRGAIRTPLLRLTPSDDSTDVKHTWIAAQAA
jgi:hypothetical protein